MASSSNRSPSPITSRINPILRTPESGNSIRKGFSGHPVAKPSIAAVPRAPANSSADFPCKNLGWKEGIRASYEQKENERDRNSLNSIRVKSPFLSKGTKNFMSPTICAASKITASPKKRALAERNEPVRTSTSFSDGKSPLPSMNLVQSSEIEEFESKSELGLDYQEVSDTPKIPEILAKPRTPDFDSEDRGSSRLPVLASSEFARTENIGTKPVMGLDSHVLSDTPKAPEVLSDPRNADFKCNGNLRSSLPVSELGLEYQEVSDAPKIPEILPKPRTADFDYKEDLGSSRLPVLASSEFAGTEKFGSKPVMVSAFTVAASLHIDSSIPPYDPETNFLSPRPQFLHYKPNPRIEVLLNKGKGFDPGEGKNLDDSFTSESCSDSEPIEETQSPDTETDSTDAISPELEAENEMEHDVLQPESHNCNAHDGNFIENSLGAKGTPRKSSCSFARPKFMSSLLVLAIVCLSVSVTDSPVIPSSSMFKDHHLTKTYAPALTVLTDSNLRDSLAEIAKFVSENLEWVSYNVRRWSMNSISYLSRMISIPKDGESGLFHFMNSTVSDTDISVNKLLPDVKRIEDIGQNEAKVKERESSEGETEQAVEEQVHQESETVEEEQGRIESETVEEEQGRLESETVDEEQHCPESEAHEIIHVKVIEEPSIVVLDEQEGQISHDQRTEQEIVEAEEIQEEFEISSHTNIEPTNVEISAQNLESACGIHSNFNVLEDKFLLRVVWGISSILLTLAAAATSLYLKKRIASVPESKILKQPLSPKKMTSDSASRDSHPYIDRSSFYRNWSAEVEMVGESVPLEMSSSIEDSSCSRRGSERMEFKSHERKSRNCNRKSLVSSSYYSAGSTSYGSFTTCEKLHSKQGSGDDDAMTPVRRSSRLRK